MLKKTRNNLSCRVKSQEETIIWQSTFMAK